MIKRFMIYKTFLNERKDVEVFNFTKNMWQKIEEIIDDLSLYRKTTESLQCENLLPGDCFKLWIKCISFSKNRSSVLSKNLYKNFVKRFDNMKENNTLFICGIFLDPRYKILLSEEEKRRALSYISSLYNNIFLKKIKEDDNILDISVRSMNDETINETSDDFERNLKQIEASRSKKIKSEKIYNQNEVRSILNSYFDEEILSSKENILAFWSKRRHGMELLVDLCLGILSIPMTQVSVERAFSSLRFMLSDQRCSLGDEVLENILLINLNRNKK